VWTASSRVGSIDLRFLLLIDRDNRPAERSLEYCPGNAQRTSHPYQGYPKCYAVAHACQQYVESSPLSAACTWRNPEASTTLALPARMRRASARHSRLLIVVVRRTSYPPPTPGATIWIGMGRQNTPRRITSSGSSCWGGGEPDGDLSRWPGVPRKSEGWPQYPECGDSADRSLRAQAFRRGGSESRAGWPCVGVWFRRTEPAGSCLIVLVQQPQPARSGPGCPRLAPL